MSNEYKDYMDDKLKYPESYPEPLDTSYEINEENKKRLAEIEKSRLGSVSSFKTEIFIDGTYSPFVTVSTNNETEFVTISFASIAGTKSINATLTKKQFLSFSKELSQFASAFLNSESEKKLLKG